MSTFQSLLKFSICSLITLNVSSTGRHSSNQTGSPHLWPNPSFALLSIRRKSQTIVFMNAVSDRTPNISAGFVRLRRTGRGRYHCEFLGGVKLNDLLMMLCSGRPAESAAASMDSKQIIKL